MILLGLQFLPLYLKTSTYNKINFLLVSGMICFCANKNGKVPNNGIICERGTASDNLLYGGDSFCPVDEVCYGGTDINHGEPVWNKKTLCTKEICWCANQNDGGSGRNGILCKNMITGQQDTTPNDYCAAGVVCVGAGKEEDGVAARIKHVLCEQFN